MSVTITTKVLDAKLDPVSGKVAITLEFTDPNSYKWQKTYTLSRSEIISLVDFKDMVTADLRRDLGIKAQLNEITPYIGKTFTLVL